MWINVEVLNHCYLRWFGKSFQIKYSGKSMIYMDPAVNIRRLRESFRGMTILFVKRHKQTKETKLQKTKNEITQKTK